MLMTISCIIQLSMISGHSLKQTLHFDLTQQNRQDLVQTLGIDKKYTNDEYMLTALGCNHVQELINLGREE